MKAWIFNKAGKPRDVLTLAEDYPKPSYVPSNKVLIKVRAAALNPVGYKMMGMIPSFMRNTTVPEADLSGTIVTLEGEESRSAHVYAYIPVGSTELGALAQYTLVERQFVFQKPEHLNFQQAAGIPLAGLTALSACKDLKEGDIVFINGASGGVGVFAIQIARMKVGDTGKVIGSCSTDNVELLKKLGADQVIDYKRFEVAKELARTYGEQKLSAVIDLVGHSALYASSKNFMKAEAVYKLIGANGEGFKGAFSFALFLLSSKIPVLLGGNPIKLSFKQLEATDQMVKELETMVFGGKIKPILDSIHEFGDVLAAYDRLISHRARGKVIVNV